MSKIDAEWATLPVPQYWESMDSKPRRSEKSEHQATHETDEARLKSTVTTCQFTATESEERVPSRVVAAVLVDRFGMSFRTRSRLGPKHGISVLAS